MIKRTIKLLSSVEDYFIMPKFDSEILKKMTESELKVLLYSAAGGDSVLGAMAEHLGLTTDEVNNALSSLENIGVITVKEEKQKKPKPLGYSSQYDNEEIADAIDENDSFRAIVDFSTEKLGKHLNRNDLNTLLALYDYHGLQAELICGIVEHCASIGKRNLSAVFNTAMVLIADGVNSYEELEGYLKARRMADGKTGRFRKLCGMGSRELTSKERIYTERWFSEMRLSFDLVKHAYEITVNNTGEVALPYMSKILEKWYAKGIKTVEEADKLEANKPKKADSGDSEIDELLAAAAKKGYLKLEQEV